MMAPGSSETAPCRLGMFGSPGENFGVSAASRNSSGQAGPATKKDRAANAAPPLRKPFRKVQSRRAKISTGVSKNRWNFAAHKLKTAPASKTRPLRWSSAVTAIASSRKVTSCPLSQTCTTANDMEVHTRTSQNEGGLQSTMKPTTQSSDNVCQITYAAGWGRRLSGHISAAWNGSRM